MAALGVPPLLWLAARRSGHAGGQRARLARARPAVRLPDARPTRAARCSRSALGLALWFAVVPLRLRGAAPLLAGAPLVAAPVVAWAFARDGLTTDDVPLAARADAGHELGALLLLLVAVLLVAGLAVGFLAAERPAAPRTRRLAGRDAARRAGARAGRAS